ncbi:MAG: hypothetical protein ACYCYI_00030 [Saccharofermentanales bacterium]
MKMIKNPLEIYIKNLFFDINIIGGYLFNLEIRIDGYNKQIVANYEKYGHDTNWLFAGKSIIVCDLINLADNGYRKIYPSGLFQVRGKEYLEFAEKIKTRESLISIELAYENFERFLKKITSQYLSKNPQFIQNDKMEKYKETMNKKGDNYNNKNLEENMNGYLKSAYKGKNNKYLLKFIRNISKEFTLYEKNNTKTFNFACWFNVLSEVRHAVVHTNFIIEKQIFEKLIKEEKDTLNKSFPGKETSIGYELSIDIKNAEKTFELLLDYGYLIFKCLSSSANYKWEIFKDQ